MTTGRLLEWIQELLRSAFSGSIIIHFAAGIIKKIEKKEVVDLK